MNLRYELIKLASRWGENPGKHFYTPGSADNDDLPLTASTVLIKQPAFYDLSKWEIVTNWYILDPRPQFIALRATYGAYYVDPTYASYRKGASVAGYDIWGYHFLLYNQNWKYQADTFLRTVKPTLDNRFTPVLDIEGYLPSGLSRATANGMIENWLNYVETSLGRPCAIYSSKNYLNQLYSYTPPIWLRDPNRKKWIAGYPYNPNSYVTMPAIYVPNGMSKDDVFAWQYSSNGIVRGITGGVDLNQIQKVSNVI